MEEENFFHLLYPFILLWFLIEVFFFVIVLYVYKCYLVPLKKPPTTSNPRESIDSVIRHIDYLSELGVCNSDDFFRFFLSAEPSDVKRGNMRSFLAWAMCNCTFEQTNKKTRLIIEEYIDVFAKKYGYQSLEEDGYNIHVNHVNFTLQPNIPFIHRPLVAYIGLGLLEMVGSLIYTLNGFQRMSISNVKYWYKTPEFSSSHRQDENKNYPLVFFHGICGGYLGYFNMIKALGVDKEVILVDFSQIRLCNFAGLKSSPSPQQYAALVKKILDRHGIERISLVGHSFGSITATWFIKHFPEQVAHLTLLDPVSILLGMPDVAVNMIYRTPSTFMELVIFIFATMDLTVSHTLYRHFFWYHNLFCIEKDLPPKCNLIIGLSENDEILNARNSFAYANFCKEKMSASHNIEVLMWKNFSHAQIMLTPSQLKPLYHLLRRNETM